MGPIPTLHNLIIDVVKFSPKIFSFKLKAISSYGIIIILSYYFIRFFYLSAIYILCVKGRSIVNL